MDFNEDAFVSASMVAVEQLHDAVSLLGGNALSRLSAPCRLGRAMAAGTVPLLTAAETKTPQVLVSSVEIGSDVTARSP